MLHVIKIDACAQNVVLHLHSLFKKMHVSAVADRLSYRQITMRWHTDLEALLTGSFFFSCLVTAALITHCTQKYNIYVKKLNIWWHCLFVFCLVCLGLFFSLNAKIVFFFGLNFILIFLNFKINHWLKTHLSFHCTSNLSMWPIKLLNVHSWNKDYLL